jgi:hypothetical protein
MTLCCPPLQSDSAQSPTLQNLTLHSHPPRIRLYSEALQLSTSQNQTLHSCTPLIRLFATAQTESVSVQPSRSQNQTLHNKPPLRIRLCTANHLTESDSVKLANLQYQTSCSLSPTLQNLTLNSRCPPRRIKLCQPHTLQNQTLHCFPPCRIRLCQAGQLAVSDFLQPLTHLAESDSVQPLPTSENQTLPTTHLAKLDSALLPILQNQTLCCHSPSRSDSAQLSNSKNQTLRSAETEAKHVRIIFFIYVYHL